jgi:O-antigen/teichoic acid export membrane protein
LLYAQDVKRVVPLTYFLVFLENAVVNLILIPRYSLDGAAVGTSISEVLVAGTLLLCARHLRGRLEVRRLLAGTLFGGCAAAAVMILFRHQLALAVPVAIVVYLALLLAHERRVFPEDYAIGRSFAVKLLRRQPRASVGYEV